MKSHVFSKNTFLAIAATAASLLVGSFEAHSAPKRGQVRDHRQHDRIQQGIQSGELTRHEARRLRKEQRKIDRMENRITADGVVTPFEKRRLNRAQNQASTDIYRQKHDSQDVNR